jgi:hypothetical protein
MLLTIASLILAITFSFKAYNSISNNNSINPNIKYNIRVAGVAMATCLALMVLILLFGIFMVGIAVVTSPGLLWAAFGGVFFILAILLILVLLIVALVYSWLAYADSTGTPVNVDILIASLAISVAIVSPFFINGSFGMPLNISLSGLNNIIPEMKSKSKSKTFDILNAENQIPQGSPMPLNRTRNPLTL